MSAVAGALGNRPDLFVSAGLICALDGCSRYAYLFISLLRSLLHCCENSKILGRMERYTIPIVTATALAANAGATIQFFRLQQ